MVLCLRSYEAADAPSLAEVFHRAVAEGAVRHYGSRERAAWCPEPPAGKDWEDRLSRAETVVAERAGRVVSFMSLDLSRGRIDFAYVAPEAMGTGVGDALYAVLEGRARAAGLAVLTAEASAVARGFFLRRGWRVLAQETVERGGVGLRRYRMEKPLQRIAEAAA